MAVDPASAIATLEGAMSSGVLEVTFSDGKRVRYAGPEEMANAISYFRGQQRVAAGRPAVSATIGAFYRD